MPKKKSVDKLPRTKEEKNISISQHIKEEELQEQFDENGNCRLCNNTGVLETRGYMFPCTCKRIRDESYNNMRNNMKMFARDVVDEIMMEEFDMDVEEMEEIKMNIAEGRKRKREARRRRIQERKNMVTLPVEGSKKNVIYDGRMFEPDGYSIFIYNNSITKLHEVVKVLMDYCNMEKNQAIHVAKIVHEKGCAVVKFTKDIEDAVETCKAFSGYGMQAEYIKH